MRKLSKYVLMALLLATMPIGLNSCSNDGVNSEAELLPETQEATLTYKMNGATNGSEPEAIMEKQGTIITLDNGTAFSRTAYIFAGWNTAADGSGTNYTGGSNFTLTSDIILYAKWNRIENSSNTLKITVGSSIFTATLASNPTAMAFKQLLPITINMSELNSNEKYYGMSKPLPTNASNPGTIQNGDLMLYGSNTLVLFYKTFSTSYSYTRIGNIDNPSGLQSALGTGSVTVSFELQ